ncbi:MAG: radical SAM protein [Dysgonamonadaceae bacterium]|jgi:radical SAM superfamily enzyme YgiQ (UPF0313 family)|nr:radical SAM protein [Dysgonamonadaceae bacterium]
MNTLILNCLPPVNIDWPSPPLSILKSFLTNNGYEGIKVFYWNIFLDNYNKDFLKIDHPINNDYINILFFLNYIAIQNNDKEAFDRVKYVYRSFAPQLINEDTFFDQHLKQSALKLHELIVSELNNLDIHNCKLFGVSAKLFQLIPANVICELVKKLNPSTTILIGGIGTKDEALAIMRNFTFYDLAIWGEGEYSLCQLYQNVLDKKDENNKDIPFLIYREGESLKMSASREKKFFDLNSSIVPDYSDFFVQNRKNIKDIRLPIEGSRGCHWQKCKFCFLNDGYRYRVKNNQRIIDELNMLMNTYSIKKFLFLDNDMVGRNIKVFEEFLDKLICLKNVHEDFEILLSEIISKGLSYNIIKKMSLAGFSHVQIGYESPSDSLLRKISKKNTVASNLLFIKWATHFSITIGGLNILRGLLEETDDDIKESIDNLHFYRFYLKNKNIDLNVSNLAIGYPSRYFKEIEAEHKLDNWTENPIVYMLPKTYFEQKDRFTLFAFVGNKINNMWTYFELIEKHYLDNEYKYILIQDEGRIFYRELYNGKKIKEIEFDKPIYWEILKICNYEVVSLQEIIKMLNKRNFIIEEAELIPIILELKSEYFLYTNYDYSEILSIINTDIILA